MERAGRRLVAGDTDRRGGRLSHLDALMEEQSVQRYTNACNRAGRTLNIHEVLKRRRPPGSGTFENPTKPECANSRCGDQLCSGCQDEPDPDSALLNAPEFLPRHGTPRLRKVLGAL